MINNFNIATDLKVELFLPDEASNVFILGISVLGSDDILAAVGSFVVGVSAIGGTDVLGESPDVAFAWQTVEAETTSAELELGGDLENSLYFQPAPGRARISMQSWTFDPNNNQNIRPGTRMRVRLDDGTINQILFSGFIDQVNASYYPGVYQPNVINITALDSYRRLVNSRIADFDTTGLPAGYATPNEVLEAVTTATGFVLSTSSDVLDGKIPAEQVNDRTAAGFINDAIQVGLGFVFIDPETAELVVKARPTVTVTPPAGTYTIGNNHEDAYHLCMSDIEVVGDADTVFNSLYVALTSDAETNITVNDQDSIDLYGYSSIDTTVNTTDTTELTRWANTVFAQSPTKLVKMVETPAIDRLGTLTEAAVFKPGELIGVKYQTTNIDIDDYYTVIKVGHSIDVDNWNTKLELWKEF